MRPDHDHALLAAVSFGALAGMRSLSAPALLAHRLAHGRAHGVGPAGHRAARVLGFLAIGEIAADKLPWTPARIRPLPLAGRALSGAAAGATAGALADGGVPGGGDAGTAAELRTEAGARAAVNGGRPLRVLASGAVGGATAVATAFATYHLRRVLRRRLHLHSAAAGVAEDGIALLIGWTAMRALPRVRQRPDRRSVEDPGRAASLPLTAAPDTRLDEVDAVMLACPVVESREGGGHAP